MSWFRNLPLGLKLNGVIIIAVVLLAASILLVLNRATNTLIDEVGQLSVEQESYLVEQRLMETQNDLDTSATLFGTSPIFLQAIEANSPFAFRVLSQTAVQVLQVDSINVINTEGSVLLESDPTVSSVAAQQDVLDLALQGTEQTTVVVTAIDNEKTVSIISVRPVTDTSGDIVGAMTMSRHLNNDMLNRINFERSGVELSLIVDNEIVAENTVGPDSEHASENFTIDTELVAATLSSGLTINPEVVVSDADLPHSEAYVPIQGIDDSTPSGVLLIRVNNDTIATFEDDLVSDASLVLGILTVLVIILVICISICAKFRY